MSPKRGIELLDSDEDLLRWIGQQRGVKLYLLKLLLGKQPERKGGGTVSKQAAYYAMSRWRALGYAQYQELDGDTWLWCLTKGMRFAGLSYTGGPPNNKYLKHTDDIALVRFYLETITQARSDYWITERDVADMFPNNKYVPDGFWVQNDTLIPILVERSWKGWDKVESAISWYCKNYKWVWFYTSDNVDKSLQPHIADNPQVSTKRLEVVRAWLESYQKDSAGLNPVTFSSGRL